MSDSKGGHPVEADTVDPPQENHAQCDEESKGKAKWNAHALDDYRPEVPANVTIPPKAPKPLCSRDPGFVTGQVC